MKQVRKLCPGFLLLVLLAVLHLSTSRVHAETVFETHLYGRWDDPNNWSQGVPDQNTDAVIRNETTAVVFAGILGRARDVRVVDADLDIFTDSFGDAGQLFCRDVDLSYAIASVSGIGSQLTISDNLLVGHFGLFGSAWGELNILSGGAVSSSLSSIDGFSKALVDGASSRWINSGDLVVDRFSELKIQNGGTVYSGRGILSGYKKNEGDAKVTVDGANSAWRIYGDLIVAYEDNILPHTHCSKRRQGRQRPRHFWRFRWSHGNGDGYRRNLRWLEFVVHRRLARGQFGHGRALHHRWRRC
jgi:T5SS/PEP-CTERM-associated repeat protein